MSRAKRAATTSAEPGQRPTPATKLKNVEQTPPLPRPQATGHESAPTVRSASEPTFSEPRLAINRVYTKKGDQGKTSLVGGQKVDKDDLRIESFGTVDELNAVVGAARQSALEATARVRVTKGKGSAANADTLESLARSLLRVQHELFNLGSLLATLPHDLHPRTPRVTELDVVMLEREMDAATAKLEPLRSFVLPGGSRLNTDLHLARTVCRRAERAVVRLMRDLDTEESKTEPTMALRYLNRLSDAFFVWSRIAAAAEGSAEVLWAPNEAASGSQEPH